MTQTALIRELSRLGTVRENELMSRHTTFGVGGPADIFLKVGDQAALRGVMRLACESGIQTFVLGSGSNILVGDGGLRGLVVANDSRAIEGPVEGEDGRQHLKADSGVSFAALARRMGRSGYGGLEWAVGIPGTLGGAVVYNAGAYGSCLADVLTAIDVMERNGSVETLPASALSLEYRGSLFTRGLFLDRPILSVTLSLRAGDVAAIARQVEALDTKRKSAQPPGRNAGSIFKNPDDRPAWWYIDKVGLRGARIGDAQISAKHANFFMNVGQARASDVKALIDEVMRRVHERFEVELHPEVALVGEGFDAEKVPQ